MHLFCIPDKNIDSKTCHGRWNIMEGPAEKKTERTGVDTVGAEHAAVSYCLSRLDTHTIWNIGCKKIHLEK